MVSFVIPPFTNRGFNRELRFLRDESVGLRFLMRNDGSVWRPVLTGFEPRFSVRFNSLAVKPAFLHLPHRLQTVTNNSKQMMQTVCTVD